MTRDYLIATVWKQCVRHVIVYLESSYAIHITPENGIEITSFNNAAKGRKASWKTRTGPYMSDQQVIDRAIALSRSKKYSLSTYNCEDFKEELLGHPPSSETRDAIIIGGMVLAVAYILSNALK